MPAPLVSVLTTVYNREKYLSECIESVLASSFRDFEYIIVDDCSSDNSHEIALTYAKRDSRIRVYRNEQNLGDYHNRNRAAAFASGVYLKYLDSDDAIRFDGLETMVAAMNEFENAGFGISRPARPHMQYPLEVSSIEAYRQHFLRGGMLEFGPSGAIIRASAFRAVCGFSGRRFVGDTELWLKLAAELPVVVFDDKLVSWRSHEAQEYTIGVKTFSYAEWSFKIGAEALLAPSCPLPLAEKAQAMDKVRWLHARRILRIALKMHRPFVALRVLRATGFSLREVIAAVRPSQAGRWS